MPEKQVGPFLVSAEDPRDEEEWDPSRATAEEIDAARSEVDQEVVRVGDELEGAPPATTLEAGNGRWVSAWVWVSDELLDDRRRTGEWDEADDEPTEDDARLLRKVGDSPANAAKSPEETGVYRCEACGNTELFEGIDHRGFPGDDCDCGARDSEDEDAECTCEATLKQDFRVDADGEVHYSMHTGGSGAEIGSYTQIDCRACGATIWAEEEAE